MFYWPFGRTHCHGSVSFIFITWSISCAVDGFQAWWRRCSIKVVYLILSFPIYCNFFWPVWCSWPPTSFAHLLRLIASYYSLNYPTIKPIIICSFPVLLRLYPLWIRRDEEIVLLSNRIWNSQITFCISYVEVVFSCFIYQHILLFLNHERGERYNIMLFFKLWITSMFVRQPILLWRTYIPISLIFVGFLTYAKMRHLQAFNGWKARWSSYKMNG